MTVDVDVNIDVDIDVDVNIDVCSDNDYLIDCIIIDLVILNYTGAMPLSYGWFVVKVRD